MIVRFYAGGTYLADYQTDAVPPIGSQFVIKTKGYHKGHAPGTVLRASVDPEFPPTYDYSDGKLIVYLDVNAWEVLREGDDG